MENNFWTKNIDDIAALSGWTWDIFGMSEDEAEGVVPREPPSTSCTVQQLSISYRAKISMTRTSISFLGFIAN